MCCRYWVLKLLIDSFQPGDYILETDVQNTNSSIPATNPFCGESWGPMYPGVVMKCASNEDEIIDIEYSDFGLPTGACGHFNSTANCTTHDAAMKLVEKACLGHNSCTVSPYPALGDPCVNVIKRFVIQARCSGTAGGTGTNHTANSHIYAQAYSGVSGRKVLVVNKDIRPHEFEAAFLSQAEVAFVDSTTVTRGAAQGIGHKTLPDHTTNFEMSPFMTAVFTLHESSSL